VADTLIEVEALSAHLGDPLWVTFDCRFDLMAPEAGYNAYLASHIPGAAYASLEHHLSGAKSGKNGRHPLPDVHQLVKFLRAHGVGNETQVIGYDARDGVYAARLWWLLRWLGHEHVAVLNGGLAAWQAADLPLDARSVVTATEGDFAARKGSTRFASLAMIENRASENLQLIDARAANRYRGEVEPIDPVAGHIPGALNRPYTDNLDASGRFLDPQALRSAFLPLIGDQPLEGIVHQCGSGVTACHNLLAMEVAGLHGSMLYPGSWSEWCADPARAVATGAP
jgi:thiosulfate/3-mercaptopyruvate sulfurtransferase